MSDSDPDIALKKLLSLSLLERITAVADDVDTRRNEFAQIDAHDLAHALGVEQPENPASGWNICSYAEQQSLEEQADHNSSVEGFVEHLKDKVTDSRFKLLEYKFEKLEDSGEWDFSFLDDEEREIIEQALAEEDLEQNQSNGMNCIASYTVHGPDGVELNFEGLVEDDGACIVLMTPYDERDGKFRDFGNSATDGWPG